MNGNYLLVIKFFVGVDASVRPCKNMDNMDLKNIEFEKYRNGTPRAAFPTENQMIEHIYKNQIKSNFGEFYNYGKIIKMLELRGGFAV